jgi:hypothetical protein
LKVENEVSGAFRAGNVIPTGAARHEQRSGGIYPRMQGGAKQQAQDAADSATSFGMTGGGEILCAVCRVKRAVQFANFVYLCST